MSKRVSILSAARRAIGAPAPPVAVTNCVQTPQPDDTVYPLLATGLAVEATHDRPDAHEGEGPYTTGLRKRFKDLYESINDSLVHRNFKKELLILLNDAVWAEELKLLNLEAAVASLLQYLAPPGGTQLKLPLTLPDTERVSGDDWADFANRISKVEGMMRVLNDPEHGRTLVGVVSSLGVWALLSSTRAQLVDMSEADERMRYAEHVVGFSVLLDVLHEYLGGLINTSIYRRKLQVLYPAPAVGFQDVDQDRGAGLIGQLLGAWPKNPGVWLQDCLRDEGAKDVEELRRRLSAEAEAKLASTVAIVKKLEETGNVMAQAAAEDLESYRRTVAAKVAVACAALRRRHVVQAKDVRLEMAGWDLAAADVKAKLSQVLAEVQQAAPSERARVWCLGLYDALYAQAGTGAMAGCLEPVAVAETSRGIAANPHTNLWQLYGHAGVGLGGLCPSGVLAQAWKRGVEGLERCMEMACDAGELEGGVGALLADRSEHITVLRAGVTARGHLLDLIPGVAPMLKHWDKKLTSMRNEFKRAALLHGSKAEASTAAATQATVDRLVSELRDMKADMRRQAQEAAEDRARLMEMHIRLMQHMAGAPGGNSGNSGIGGDGGSSGA